jgi:hypothetical protein
VSALKLTPRRFRRPAKTGDRATVHGQRAWSSHAPPEANATHGENSGWVTAGAGPPGCQRRSARRSAGKGAGVAAQATSTHDLDLSAGPVVARRRARRALQGSRYHACDARPGIRAGLAAIRSTAPGRPFACRVTPDRITLTRLLPSRRTRSSGRWNRPVFASLRVCEPPLLVRFGAVGCVGCGKFAGHGCPHHAQNLALMRD